MFSTFILLKHKDREHSNVLLAIKIWFSNWIIPDIVLSKFDTISDKSIEVIIYKQKIFKPVKSLL